MVQLTGATNLYIYYVVVQLTGVKSLYMPCSGAVSDAQELVYIPYSESVSLKRSAIDSLIWTFESSPKLDVDYSGLIEEF